MDIGFLLAQSTFFKGVSQNSRNLLADICLPKSYVKDETLFHEGQKGHAVFLLASGSVQLFRSTAKGRDVVIKLIGPGEIFGEVILFERDSFPVNAVALKKSEVYVLPKPRFLSLLNDKGFRNDFIGMLMKKQRYLAEMITSVSSMDVRQRFFKFLRDNYGSKQEYRINVAKKDIASAIGTIPETFSRMIRKLKDEGAIEWKSTVLKIIKDA